MSSGWLLAIAGVALAVCVIYFAGSNDRQWRRSRAWNPSGGTMLQGEVQWRGTTRDGLEILVLLRNDEERAPSHSSGALNTRLPFEYQWVIAVGGRIWEEHPVVAGSSFKDQRTAMITRARHLDNEREKRFGQNATQPVTGGHEKKKKRKRKRLQ